MQVYKESKSTADLSGSLNKGNYIVSFDLDNDEAESTLPYSHYLMIKSSASIDDVKRNIRYILSSFPEAFCFSFYGNNSLSQTFNRTNGSIKEKCFLMEVWQMEVEQIAVLRILAQALEERLISLS